MFSWWIYGPIMLEIDINDSIEEVYVTVKKRIWKLNGSGFILNNASKVTIQYVKVNEAKGSSYIKSTDRLRCKKCNNKSKKYQC